MNRKYTVAIAILAVTALLTVFFEGRSPALGTSNQKARRIPLALGPWKGGEEPVHQAVVENLGTEDLLMRTYADDKGNLIVFAAVFAMDNRRAAHPPEICYQGQGWSVDGNTTRFIPMRKPQAGYIPDEGSAGEISVLDPLTEDDLTPAHDFGVTELVIRQGTEFHVVHYWYKTGSMATNRLLVHELYMLINNIFSRGASNSLLRVSAKAKSGSPADLQKAREAVQDFCKTVFPYTIAAMP